MTCTSYVPMVDPFRSSAGCREAKDLQIKNLKNEVANGRSHRFGPTTEQRNLLNNRPTDTEGERKQDFDGTPESLPPDSEQPKDNDSDGVAPKKQKRKKETQKRQPKQPHKVDETVTHEVEEYYELPEGSSVDMCSGLSGVTRRFKIKE